MEGDIIKDSQSFGAYVRRRRKKAGLRQTDLADAAGVSYRFVLDLESGKETAQLGKALRVLDVLGVRLRAEPPPITGHASVTLPPFSSRGEGMVRPGKASVSGRGAVAAKAKETGSEPASEGDGDLEVDLE